MNLGVLAPEAAWTWGALCLLLPALLLALISAPWRALAARRERQNALGVAVVSLPLLWSMSPGLPVGVGLQLMGMTCVALVFGWQLALLAGLLAGLILVVVGSWSLVALPVNLVLVVCVPVAVTMAILWAANQLPRTNLFVYMLGVAFGGSMLAMLATFSLGSLLLNPGLDHAVVMLMTFPEGFINGAIITAIGLAFWLGITLTPPTIASPTMIMTLAVANCVHLLVTFLQRLRHAESKPAAMRESLRVNLQPVFITSLTTAIGFLSMNFSDAPPFRDLGNIVAIGFYGGFIQMGMGIFYLAALVLLSKIPIIESNAIKGFTVFLYSIIAVAIFEWSGLIDWKIGLLMGVGQFIGSWFTAKLASRYKGAEKWAYWMLVIAIALAIFRLFDVF